MVEVEGRYDMVRVYLPRQRMNSVAESMADRPEVRLRLPNPGFDDYVISNLLNIISFAFDNREQTSQLLVDEISILLMSHLIHNYSDRSPIARSRGGLASWQERIAKEILHRPNLRSSNRGRARPMPAACRPDISSAHSGSRPGARRISG